MIIATQAYTSFHGVLDKRHADVLMLNLSNELIFTVANHDSAVIASKNIGEREVVEKSWGWTAGKRSYNYQRKIKPFFEPYRLRKLLSSMPSSDIVKSRFADGSCRQSIPMAPIRNGSSISVPTTPCASGSKGRQSQPATNP